MAAQFEFTDFVMEFWVDFTVYSKAPGTRDNVGKWIEGTETAIQTGGIILPLTNDELKREANGVYTSKDRKIYTLHPLNIGQRLVYNNQSYTIDSNKDYGSYTDVFIYFAKGVEL